MRRTVHLHFNPLLTGIIHKVNKVDGLELEDESEDGEQHDETSGPRTKPIPILCRVDPASRDHVSSGGTGNCVTLLSNWVAFRPHF